ncbi:MAG TPA: DUF3093 domain-containing protein [Marmoricola sp.]|nr:DUF3093 domain-containing protein [Marmoricola sp.]HNO39139.1 DUF3093 domain-containing protein [Marmoricola sp.]
MGDTLGTVDYQERLRVPLRWWAQITMLLATLWLAFIIATPAWLAWTVSGVLLGFAYGVLAWIGAARVRVAHGVLYAGAAHISARHLGEIVALDKEATRELLGVGADARAYLLTRPYLKRSVRVQITDPADPTPYWVIGTRRPAELASAINAARAEVLG